MDENNNFDFTSFLDSFTKNAGKIAEIKSVFDDNKNSSNTATQQQYERLQQNQNFISNLDTKYIAYGGVGLVALIFLMKGK